MAVSVALPGWKPQDKKPEKDPLDMIQQGLQIAAAAYGIYSDSEKLDLARKTQELASTKESRADAANEAQIQLHQAQAKALAAKPTSSYREVKYIKDGKPVIASLRSDEPLPAGAIPYEEPKDGGINSAKRFDIANTIQKEFEGATAESKGRYDAATRVNQLLDLKNPIADAAAKYQFLKTAGNVGATSDKEMELVGGSKDLKSRAVRAFEKASSGIELTDQDRRDMKEAADKMRLLAQKDVMDKARKFSKQKAGISPFTESEIYDELLRPNDMFREIDQAMAAANQQPATGILPQQFYSPQGRPFAQQARQQQVQATWGQRTGMEAGAAPSPQPTQFDPDAFLGRK